MASATRLDHIPRTNIDKLPRIPLLKSPELLTDEDIARYRYAWPNIDFYSAEPRDPSIIVKEEPESVFDIPPISRAAAHLRYALMKARYVIREGQPDKNCNQEKQLELELDFYHPFKVLGTKSLVRIVEYPNLEGQNLRGYWHEKAPSEDPELPIDWNVSELGATVVSSEVTIVESGDSGVTNTPLAA